MIVFMLNFYVDDLFVQQTAVKHLPCYYRPVVNIQKIPIFQPGIHRLIQILNKGDIVDLTQFIANQRCLNLFFRSEEHKSELQSLMRSSYAVTCLTQTNNKNTTT